MEAISVRGIEVSVGGVDHSESPEKKAKETLVSYTAGSPELHTWRTYCVANGKVVAVKLATHNSRTPMATPDHPPNSSPVSA